LLAMYLVAAEKQGISWDQVRGKTQNDILKEYMAWHLDFPYKTFPQEIK